MGRDRTVVFANELQLTRGVPRPSCNSSIDGDRHDEHQLPVIHKRTFSRGLHQQVLPSRDEDYHVTPARVHPSHVTVIPGTPPKLRLLKLKQASKYRIDQQLAPCTTDRVGMHRSNTLAVSCCSGASTTLQDTGSLWILFFADTMKHRRRLAWMPSDVYVRMHMV